MGFAHAYAQVTLEARRATYYYAVGGGVRFLKNGTKSAENKYCPVISSHTVDSSPRTGYFKTAVHGARAARARGFSNRNCFQITLSEGRIYLN